jgi:hypothetical protein
MRLPSPQSECYQHAIALCGRQSEGLGDNIFWGSACLACDHIHIRTQLSTTHTSGRSQAALSCAAKRCAFPNIAHSIFSRVHVALMVVAVL